jgi:uncharacterized protein (DUF1810 family)
MDDPFNLQRFASAQDDGGTYDRAVQELRRGHKTSHWMWFIFPQIQGLGLSAIAQRYAIASLAEAKAYLAHDALGARLRECTQLVIQVKGKTIREIVGQPDDMKFRSSMTLFAQAAPDEPCFAEALQKYFAGESDPLTLARL